MSVGPRGFASRGRAKGKKKKCRTFPLGEEGMLTSPVIHSFINNRAPEPAVYSVIVHRQVSYAGWLHAGGKGRPRVNHQIQW